MTTVRTVNVGNYTGTEISVKARWWTAEDVDLYQSVFAVVNGIETNDTSRSLNNLRFARLYANTDIPALTPFMYSKLSADGFLKNRVTLNVIKSCIDTVAAQIASSKPRPMFLTSDGDWSQQKRAEKLTAYMDGVFDEAKIYEVGKRCFVDAAVFGTGFMKIHAVNGKIVVERVFPDEIVVDAADGIYENPRQMHQRRLMSREVMIELFPDAADKLEFSTTGKTDLDGSRAAADLVTVIESWHLSAGENATDGRHTICVDNCTLFSESWDKQWFPFAMVRWSPGLVGYFGHGLAEELVGIQLEINKMLLNIQRAQHFMSVPRVFVDAGSTVNTSLVNNEIGAIIKYSGAPPVFSTPQAMTPEIYQHLERLFEKAFQITGVSQMSAQSKKEPGVESGVALRTLRDVQSERFLLTAQAYEQFFMDAADKIVELSYTIGKSDRSLSVQVVDRKRKRIDEIKWSDVKMDKESFKMQVFPTAFLPTTPAGRLQTVQDLMQGGFIDPDSALDLLDFPDLQSYFNLKTAAVDDIKSQIELMIEEGKYQPPEKYQNLNLALEMVQSAYLRAKLNHVEEDRLELLRNYMDDILTLTGQNEQVAATQAVNLTQSPVTPSVSVLPEQPQQPPIEGAPTVAELPVPPVA